MGSAVLSAETKSQRKFVTNRSGARIRLSPYMLLLNYAFQSTGGASGMRAALNHLPLGSLLELIHTSQQTGLLEVEGFLNRSSLTLRVAFLQGEIVDSALLDWQGLDALFGFPQDIDSGHAEFWQIDTQHVHPQAPLAPFNQVMSEWARLTDEWPRYIEWLGSGSTRLEGEMAPFNQPGGCSVRAAAHMSQRALHEVAATTAELVKIGLLRPKANPPHQEWQFLALPPLSPMMLSSGSILTHLDGQRSLFEAQLEMGTDTATARDELLRAIQRGYRFAGCGWVMRDLIWEQGWQQSQQMVL